MARSRQLRAKSLCGYVCDGIDALAFRNRIEKLSPGHAIKLRGERLPLYQLLRFAINLNHDFVDGSGAAKLIADNLNNGLFELITAALAKLVFQCLRQIAKVAKSQFAAYKRSIAVCMT